MTAKLTDAQIAEMVARAAETAGMRTRSEFKSSTGQLEDLTVMVGPQKVLDENFITMLLALAQAHNPWLKRNPEVENAINPESKRKECIVHAISKKDKRKGTLAVYRKGTVYARNLPLRGWLDAIDAELDNIDKRE